MSQRAVFPAREEGKDSRLIDCTYCDVRCNYMLVFLFIILL